MTELAAHGDALRYEIVINHEKDGNWTATIETLGVCAAGTTDIEARSKIQVRALRAIADRIEADGSVPDQISFAVWLG
ncbi:MAG TPA: hypothetical protein VGG72_28465 [Bryobacteraceae bacterium]|jgi:predicted RNase H-like HicB family nuclease